MATSPNYGWLEPDNTDLVKNGALAIRTLGNAIDTTMATMTPKSTYTAKGSIAAATGASTPANLAIGNNGETLVADSSTASGLAYKTKGVFNGLTTTGDTIYSSSGTTQSRLPIGTTGQVLTVAGGVPSWATPAAASSGLTLIARTAFSNVAGQAFDNVFTSTYKQYMVVIENISAATSSDDLLLQFRYAGPTTQASGYYGSLNYSTWNTALTTTFSGNTSSMTLAVSTGTSTEPTTATMYFSLVGNSNQLASFYGQIMTGVNESQGTFGGRVGTSRTYTGFILSSSSTNITGTVSIYGLATA